MAICPHCFTELEVFDAHGNESCPKICWFWKAVEQMEKEENENSIAQKAVATNYIPYQNVVNVNFENHFTALKTKWFYGNVPENCSDPHLYQMLLNLERRFVFDGQVDIEWLENRSFYSIIANIYFQRFLLTANGWNLAKACSSFRKAKYPEIGIQITNQYATNDKKLYAAILTTRGGAFKDLKDLSNAENRAQIALSYNRSKYPLTLLGAIYYMYGRFAEGDEFFREALNLGASAEARDREIKIAVESAEVVVRKTMAEHLIHKDPNRYSWAKMYIEK